MQLGLGAGGFGLGFRFLGCLGFRVSGLGGFGFREVREFREFREVNSCTVGSWRDLDLTSAGGLTSLQCHFGFPYHKYCVIDPKSPILNTASAS